MHRLEEVMTITRRSTHALRNCLMALATVATLAVASVAAAQQAYVFTRTSLRAGPDRGYPQVAWLGSGTTVYVNGCVRGYHWCDITSGPYRGWANARHLQYPYNNQRMTIYGNGGRFGLPVVGFALGSYWDNHYRGQSWYHRRDHWNGWHPGSPAPVYNGFAPGHPQYRPHVVAPHAGFAPPHQQQFHPVRPQRPVTEQAMRPPVQHAPHAQPARAMGEQRVHGNHHRNDGQR
jgi:uncharacterized protein YraI